MTSDKGNGDAVNDKTQGVTIDTSKIPQHVEDNLGATLWQAFQRFIAVPENKAWLDAEAEKMKGGTANGSS